MTIRTGSHPISGVRAFLRFSDKVREMADNLQSVSRYHSTYTPLQSEHIPSVGEGMDRYPVGEDMSSVDALSLERCPRIPTRKNLWSTRRRRGVNHDAHKLSIF